MAWARLLSTHWLVEFINMYLMGTSRPDLVVSVEYGGDDRDLGRWSIVGRADALPGSRQTRTGGQSCESASYICLPLVFTLSRRFQLSKLSTTFEIPVIPSPSIQFKSGIKHYIESQLDEFSQFTSSDYGTFKSKMYFLMVGKNDHDFGFLPAQVLVPCRVQ
jgi:hypothetical protein